ncbi:hypothetical protein JXO52_13640 [bacterium]|nr:hypothetical protein [bacterium]
MRCIGLFGDIDKSDIARFREAGMQYTLSLPLVPALLTEMLELVIPQADCAAVEERTGSAGHTEVNA